MVFGFALPAVAQGSLPTPGTSTTWQLQTARLDALLNDGWLVHSTAGGEGENFLLVKGNKFIMCHLSGSRNSMMRLDLNNEVYSICHALN